MVNAGPVTGPGEVAGAVAVLRDVTAMKRVQAAKSTFVTMVAHEVKAPLAAIENYISVVLGGAAGDPGGDRKKLERCAVRASALRQMISELAKLMEIEAGRTRLERRMTDLAGIVEDAVAHFREVADGKGVDLSVDPCVFAADLQIFADRDAMATVLRNSVDNAVKYTPDGGRVCVRADRDDCFLTISVVDTGIGMTGDERARVFDEFYRVRSRSTAAIPGTGLGLSIVKRLVEMHQGRIRVKSAPGAGSDFAVSLPVPPCAGR